MEANVQPQTNPEAVVPRFCGYCRKRHLCNQSMFLVHLHKCEKDLMDIYHSKRKPK